MLRADRNRIAKRPSGLGAISLIALIAIAVGAWYYFHRPHHKTSNTQLPAANSRSSAGHPRMAEFETLFADGTPLSSFARPGEYTVVEVYLDVCAYCRELESALGPFNDRRPDVSLVRVHHPGHMSIQLHGNSRDDMQRQAEAFNVKMQSYGFCGTPHVEVYGPDRQPLAIDTCKSRAGTIFMWDWIGTETGTKPHRDPGGRTGA